MESPTVPPEPLGACLRRAALSGAAFAVAVGACECARLLFLGAPRYGDVAVRLVLLALGGYALVGAALGLVTGALARTLWRPPAFRAARASTCAGFGTFLALAAFAATHRVGPAFLLPAACAGTLLALALRELLAWWPAIARPRPWVAAGLLALAAGGVAYAVRGGASAAPDGAARRPDPAGPRPNVVLVTLDTLRADHVGCYGAQDARTPAIDALAAEGVRFLDATSQANTTGPSHATLLTGLHPHSNGARRNGVPLAHGVATLPELLAAQGYRTAGFVSGFTLAHEACGLAPRFERYGDDFSPWPLVPAVASRLRLWRAAQQVAARFGAAPERVERPAGETVGEALDWLAGVESEGAGARPFFLWVHLFDPHCPYAPPAEFGAAADPAGGGVPPVDWYSLSTREREALVADPRAVERQRAAYRAEIAYADSQVRRLCDALRARGAWDETLVVLTADHGEGLGEHGYWFDHGTYLYDAELSVPLIVRLPRGARAGATVAEQARLLDVAPTVLDALGLAVPESMEGISLLPALRGEAFVPRPSFAQGEVGGELSGHALDGRTLSLRAGGRKWIWTSAHWLDSVRVPERFELFDLARDPGETRDAAADAGADPGAAELREMRARLEAWRDATSAGARDLPLAPGLRDELRKLGYF